jgi:hypothetical protein
MRPFRNYNEGSMSKWAAIRAVLKIYRWKLIVFVVAVITALLVKNITAADAPPGGAPNPDIDPM